MADGKNYKLQEIPRCFNEPKKGCVILTSTDNSFVNANYEINNQHDDFKNQLLSKMGQWVTSWATGLNMDFCHGYDKSEHDGKCTNCYQFEIGFHRLYGFLCHPLQTNRRFLLFVGVHVLEKHYWRTDKRVLNKLVELSEDESVISSIKNFVYGYGRSGR